MTGLDKPLEGTGVASAAWKFHWSPLMRLVISVGVAGLVAFTLAHRVTRQLKISTDVVGYPVYAAFNIERYIDYYYIALFFFPLVALLLYFAQTVVANRLGIAGPPSRWRAIAEPAIIERHVTLGAISRVAAVGAALGFELTIIANIGGAPFWLALAAFTIAYVALAVVASRVARGRFSTGAINAMVAPVTILGLLGVSASQTVAVASDGTVHHYAWLPWWLAVPLTAAIVGWLWRRLSQSKDATAVRTLEQSVLLYVTAPITLFLLLSQLAGDVGYFDAFHAGEGLVAGRLTGAGWLYWRDLLSTHGLLQDGLEPLFDMRVLGNSRWGLDAGRALFLDPIAWVSLFVLLAWLCRRSWAMVLAFFVLIAGGELGLFFDSRFIFWPLILLLLAAVLQRRVWWLTILLAVSLVAQAILVPETAYCILACGAVVFLHDLYQRKPGTALSATFAQTIWLTAGGVVSFAGFCLYLLSQHALGDFFFYYAVFAPGHELTGGLPLQLFTTSPLFPFLVAVTPLALLVGVLYYSASLILRRPLDTRDWVVAASALVALPYYQKFIDRTDLGHVTQALNMAYPLIVFLFYRGVTYADSWIRRSGSWDRVFQVTAQPVAVLVLVAAVGSTLTTNALHTAAPLPTRVMSTPDRYHRTVAVEPEFSTVGYGSYNLDAGTVNDLGKVFQTYLGPNDWVLDFSNEPGLIYFVLPQTPHTRYYHMTMAIAERAQKDMIDELKKNPPKLVIYSNDNYGLLNWDGIPNMVRHYDVSQYILDNYTPLLSTHTQIIYGLTSANLSTALAFNAALVEPPVVSDLPFRGFACDWGYTPNFLSIAPPPPLHQAASVTLTPKSDPNATITMQGWVGDITTGQPAVKVVAVIDGTVVGESVPGIDRPDVAVALNTPGFATSGYRLTFTVPDEFLSRPNAVKSIRVFGISAGGDASELIASPGGSGPALSQLKFAAGPPANVRSGATTGIVDSITPLHQTDLSVPSGVVLSDYRWMEIDTSSRYGDDVWTVSDVQTGDPGHQIIFRTLGTSPEAFHVYVGSCAQWHGYNSTQLLLGHGLLEDITAVRLLP